jgi:hypothetical protein
MIAALNGIPAKQRPASNQKLFFITFCSGIATPVVAILSLVLIDYLDRNTSDVGSAIGGALFAFLVAGLILVVGQGWALSRLLGGWFWLERLVSFPLTYAVSNLFYNWINAPTSNAPENLQTYLPYVVAVTLYALSSSLLILYGRNRPTRYKLLAAVCVLVVCVPTGSLSAHKSHENVQSRQTIAQNELNFTIFVPVKADSTPLVYTPVHDGSRHASVAFDLTQKGLGSPIEITETKANSDLQKLLASGGCDESSLRNYLGEGSTATTQNINCQPQPGTNIWYYEDTDRNENDFAYAIKSNTVIFFKIPRYEWSKSDALQIISDAIQSSHPASQRELDNFTEYQ